MVSGMSVYFTDSGNNNDNSNSNSNSNRNRTTLNRWTGRSFQSLTPVMPQFRIFLLSVTLIIILSNTDTNTNTLLLLLLLLLLILLMQMTILLLLLIIIQTILIIDISIILFMIIVIVRTFLYLPLIVVLGWYTFHGIYSFSNTLWFLKYIFLKFELSSFVLCFFFFFRGETFFLLCHSLLYLQVPWLSIHLSLSIYILFVCLFIELCVYI